ncbi:hypothetical protein [Streptomyces flavofungini]|uniref:hypothetical protein n=1 Tax=Streptomyces flavofungini TaxID=68200 RepID=UPI0019CC54ED|nr:hypothetical protein [Streptomyces flavofungini]GHC88594.1 hypothetical protein GCM10010349_75980 [Streptomyces flavofungini]
MTGHPLIIETPSGAVHASVEPRVGDAVVFTLTGALRGSVHLTGTHDPCHWDQFTAISSPPSVHAWGPSTPSTMPLLITPCRSSPAAASDIAAA